MSGHRHRSAVDRELRSGDAPGKARGEEDEELRDLRNTSAAFEALIKLARQVIASGKEPSPLGIPSGISAVGVMPAEAASNGLWDDLHAMVSYPSR